MTRPLHALTTRGRCLLGAGVGCAIGGASLDDKDLIRIAVLLVALPVIALVVTGRTRLALSSTRWLEPARVAAGATAHIRVRLENVSRLPTGVLLVEDTIPYLLGGRPRAVVDRLSPHQPVDVGYDLDATARGRYTLGPLTVRLTDPFGVCELPRAFVTTETLVVTPAVVSLPPVRLTGEWAGAGESTTRAVATAGEDDTATREYRQGDDLRRIHWRTTARRGELTVRREEQPWQSRGAVLLDTRSVAHHGEGLSSSFEWAVSAAASIGIHLADTGFGMRLVTDTGADVSSAGLTGGSFTGALLDGLAVLGPSGNRSLQVGVGALRRQGGEGLLVAVIGQLTAADAEQLARLRSGSRSVGVAILLRTASWETGRRSTGSAGVPGRSVLHDAGWRTVEAERDSDLRQLWETVGPPGPPTAMPRLSPVTVPA